ncbi:hypothetical protein BDN72DRAFT_899486 [Pluteus cervinus]|uniref:Uncharacterized protein n=1 Tax=Pluteus cervinus TaxID=181527 RepID=A0ACD3ALS6_9AGAR|nr:hypothetical protein BDN72DRAFT_899486 [Pluteus cervinus]
MPSFLSKVFGRKKDEKESSTSQGRASDASLLEGKFEHVSPTVSPTIANFPEAATGKGVAHGKDKDGNFGLFKSKPRTSSADPSLKPSDLPQLSLSLPTSKGGSSSRTLDVLFEGDPSAPGQLADPAIGGRRLKPLETLLLVQACSQAITARGLETLGVMHPHWYSASEEVQRRLINLFIRSLASNGPTTLSQPSSSTAEFEAEVVSTRSPHDVAAVLRWGIRHLQLENNRFGKEERWYKTFFDAEAAAQYPNHAFSEQLAPLLPNSHLQLLQQILEILSSLAAHAEANSTSGSKLSKLFGLWLLDSHRVDEKDDWTTFYDRWERSGRMLEHLFLSRIRDDAQRMPTRLLELVKQYPYGKLTSPEPDLIPRPRFSTRRYDALLVRVQTELPSDVSKPPHKPLHLIFEALKANHALSEDALTPLWEAIKIVGNDTSTPSPGGYPGLGRLFTDETLRILSLVPIETGDDRPFSWFSQNNAGGGSRRRSFSLGDKSQPVGGVPTAIAHVNGNADPKGHAKTASDAANIPLPMSPISPTHAKIETTDWAQFSTTGFSETSPLGSSFKFPFLEKEVEKTKPGPKSKRAATSPQRSRKSLDTSAAVSTPSAPQPEEIPPPPLSSKVTQFSLVQLDEAFIDFWSDSLLDPISSNWPLFVLCKLKNGITGLDVDGKRVEWLIVERIFAAPPSPAPVPTSSSEGHAATSESTTRRPRPSSPKSFRSDLSDTFSSTKKRFSFFGSSSKSSNPTSPTKSKKKFGKSPKIGELGEILQEEEEKPQLQETVKLNTPTPKGKEVAEVTKEESSGAGLTTAVVTAAAVASVAVAATAAIAATESEPTKDDVPVPVETTPEAATEETDVSEPAHVEVEQPVETLNEEPVVEEPAAESEPEPVAVTAEVPVETPAPVAASVPVEASSKVEQLPTPARTPSPQQPATPSPEPVVEVAAPAKEATPEPEPVVEKAPTPEPVVEKAPTPEPVVEVTSVPEPVVEEVLAPDLVVEEAAAPEPVVEEVSTPDPVVEEAPSPVAEETSVPEPLVEEAPVVEEVSTPKPVVEEVLAPELIEETPAPAPEAPVEVESVVEVIDEDVAAASEPVVEEPEAPVQVEEEPIVTESGPAVEALVAENVVVVEELQIPEPVIEEPIVEELVVEEVEEAAAVEEPEVVAEELVVETVAEEAEEEVLVEEPAAPVTPPREPTPVIEATPAPVASEPTPVVEEDEEAPAALVDSVLEEVPAVAEAENAAEPEVEEVPAPVVVEEKEPVSVEVPAPASSDDTKPAELAAPTVATAED